MTAIDAIAGVVNACQPLPTLLTGGQPDLHHLRALKGAGTALVLDIRAGSEARPFNEPQTIADLGMAYVNIPVGPTPLNDALMEAILAVLRERRDETVFFHCGTGNRVGGALLPFLILDHGMEEEDALAIASRVGLRSPELMQWGVEYARRHAG